MGIKERKQKHKEDLRSKILEAAKELFVKEGFEATSIRKIAAKIEFSPTTIYLYYKDKNDIAYALHQEGFSLLRTQFLPLMHVESAFERLKAIGKAYIDFGFKNPDYYFVMFMLKDPMDFVNQNCGDEWEEGERVFDFLEQTIVDCQAEGYFKDMDKELMAVNAWTSVHGMVSLYLMGHLKKVAEVKNLQIENENLIEESFKLYIDLLARTKQ
ncbi:TetR/AcrR family transcriptional regulator [Sphingobacterium hungaricum]|uniref:TetR family transcriptional regulator n=1 Tax=Sphingobacterium hungaricum TaxID=2082723 RepID=A0A928YQJ9_9SPHI|nr:TetR/AcrR family transcriptional regulator [Sphingobacterium hungaricum]MBE8714311.1 TetR family transcriptional regulator [Sphingobacterium hungaricum]